MLPSLNSLILSSIKPLNVRSARRVALRRGYGTPASQPQQQQSLSRKEKRRLENASHQRQTHRYIQGETGPWEVVIGLEVHAQIQSNSKLFSSAPVGGERLPNSQVALFDASIPGTLPVLNQWCVEQAVRTGAALKGQPQINSRFDRKHYFYHDLPLGYQITQFFHPIVSGGEMVLNLKDGTSKVVNLERIQLETDSGKSIHDAHPSLTLVDLNRAGVALMEIISKPEMNTSEEAAQFMKKLAYLLRHIDASFGSIEEGSLRCDANVSVRRPEGPLGERCEIKNLNSVRHLMNAIEYEARRHIKIIEGGGDIEMETRWFDPVKKLTLTGRKKEDKVDYRFFPEPDLPPLVITEDDIRRIAASLPELPDDTLKRISEQYGIEIHHAQLISIEEGGTKYFEELAKLQTPQIAAQWMINELLGHMNEKSLTSFDKIPVNPKDMSSLINLINSGELSALNAKKVLELVFGGDTRNFKQIISDEKMALLKIESTDLEAQCQSIIDKFPDEAARYRSGNERMMKHFVGQMMKETQGRADPVTTQRAFEKLLKK